MNLKRFLVNLKNLPKKEYVEKTGVDFCCGIGLLQKKSKSRVKDMEFPRDEEADRTEY